MYEMNSNNQVTLCGEIVSEFQFSHEVFGEKFYIVTLGMPRNSGNAEDRIPCMVSERLMNVSKNYIGTNILFKGQYRSFNKEVDDKKRLDLTLFVREYELHNQSGSLMVVNYALLDGYIVKPPVYRKTPKGREIADLLIAVNRPYGKSDYIPCICWGRNARFASFMRVGDHITLDGRIQSREYMKKFSDEKIVPMIAYEVSISKLLYSEEEAV